MALHERQVIRDAVVEALLGSTAAGASVFAAKVTPWLRVQLPAISVYTTEEAADPKTWRGDSRRHLSVVVALVDSLTDGVADSLDALALEVETILMANRTLGGAHDVEYQGASISFDPNAERPVGSLEMTFDVTYFPGGRA